MEEEKRNFINGPFFATIMRCKALFMITILSLLGLSGCLEEEQYIKEDELESTCFAIVQFTREYMTNDTDAYNSSYTITNNTYDASCQLIQTNVTGDIYHTIVNKTYNASGVLVFESTLYFDDFGGSRSDVPTYIWNTTYVYEDGNHTETRYLSTEWGESSESINRHFYNEEGQLIRTTFADTNRSAVYAYDADGNMVREDAVEGDNVTETTLYAYENGLLMNITSPTYEISYTYDQEGNEQTYTKIQRNYDSIMYRNSTYDEQGHLLSIEETTEGEPPWVYIETFTWEAIDTEMD